MTDHPGGRGLWKRGRAHLSDGVLQFVGEPTYYDPFSPYTPLPYAEELSHHKRPWQEGAPLVADAVAQVDSGSAFALETFAEHWGLLTTDGDAEPVPVFREAALTFRTVCERLVRGDAPDARDMNAHLAGVHPTLSRVEPGAPRRWAFSSLVDAAYFQLAWCLGEGRTLAVCQTADCGKLFVAWRGKLHHDDRCRSKMSMRVSRARRREEEEGT